LNSFNRLFVLCLLLATIVVVACEDNPLPPPPEPPPQITVDFRYTYNSNVSQDTTTGLQNDDAFDIIVDSQDRTWVATQGGVSRFRGRTGDGTWNQNNTLPNPKCRSLLEYHGKIWIGTWGGGVATYDMNGDLWSVLDQDSGLVNDMVGDIAAAGDSTIYFATNNGASIYVDDDQLDMSLRWTTYPIADREADIPTDGILVPVISAVEIADTPGRGVEVWFAPRVPVPVEEGKEANYGITVFREGQLFPDRYYTMVNSALADPDMNDIFYDPDTDLFWLAFSRVGVASVDVDAKTWTYYRMADGLPSNVVYSITKVGDVIWAGTQGGVARMRPDGTWQGYGTAGGLPADRVRRVYSNDPSQLWACFIEQGAAKLKPGS
jgi:hypothetical protein